MVIKTQIGELTVKSSKILTRAERAEIARGWNAKPNSSNRKVSKLLIKRGRFA